MRNYYIQRRRGSHWYDLVIPATQSVKYARGYQDALHVEHPTWLTRLVWRKGAKQETVRTCGPAEGKGNG